MAELKQPTSNNSEYHRKIVIVGAGPTGLGAAWRLEELFTNKNFIKINKS